MNKPNLNAENSLLPTGYTKAVIKLLSSDEMVRQYMMQVALYISAHYGNVDLVREKILSIRLLISSLRLELCFNSVLEPIDRLGIIRHANGVRRTVRTRNTFVVRFTKRSFLNKSASFFSSAAETWRFCKNPTVTESNRGD